MTDLILVRHAETIWHAENRYTGSSDVPLSDHGVGQAGALARWASTASLAAIYSSTLSRAIETAHPAAESARLAPHTDARLCEVDFGEGEGMTRAEMALRFPEALDAFLARPASSPLPGGEAGTAAVARARPALEEIAETDGDAAVLVVMHSTLLRLLLCSMLGIDLERYRRVFPSVRNCALTTVRTTDSGFALVDFNVVV